MRYVIAILLTASICMGAITYTDNVTSLGTSGGINYYDLSGSAPAVGADYPDLQPAFTNSTLFCEFTNAGSEIADNSFYGLQAVSNGTGGAASTWNDTNGVFSTSRDFDGVADFVRANDNANLSHGDSSSDSPFSMGAWVNMDDASSFWIISKSDANANAEYVMGMSNLDKFTVALYDSGVTASRTREGSGTETSAEGAWTFYMMTYDGVNANGITLYKNGALIAMAAGSDASYTAMHDTTAPLYIGRFRIDSSIYADGDIDMPMQYSVELTSNEVFQIFRNTNWQNPDNGTDIGGASEEYINPGKGFAAP